MSASPSNCDLPIDAEVARKGERSRSADFLALTKPRLNFLVVITTLAAFYLAAEGPMPVALLLHTVVGTALVAGGASALNQLWERDIDRLMRRTRMRPLPDLRLHPREALWFGVALSGAGLAELAWGANGTAAAVAAVTLVSYVLFYTPLKVRTSLSTIVGAVPGALPAVIGWAAATGTVSIEAWVLFAIVFMWQMPHFLAIAWMFRDEYARAGIPLLPVLQPDGRSTGRQALLYTVALVPVSFLPVVVDLGTIRYLVGAFVLGAVLMWFAVEFAATRSVPAARRLFLGSILYLPLLWVVLIWDHLTR